MYNPTPRNSHNGDFFSLRMARKVVRSLGAIAFTLFLFLNVGCNSRVESTSSLEVSQSVPSKNSNTGTAVLLVSHGSHSAQWRESLLDLEDEVKEQVLACEQIDAMRSAFMEYNEPSIATRLKEFDQEGYEHVLLVPLLLTVSSHSFDDIPTIIGRKEDYMTTETLKLENVEIYKPKAEVEIAPLLDFASILEKNVIRRVREMSENPQEEGVVLVAYGSEQYDEEWTHLLEHVGSRMKEELGIDSCHHSWCGHIARYRTEPTEAAIKKVLEEKDHAIVIPVLVAVDETFQGKIIGGAVKNVGMDDRIRYRHDAILPDENVRQWIIAVCQQFGEVSETTLANEM